MVKEDILEPVQYAKWEAPVLPVLISDETVHVCCDFKVMVNRALKVDKYPIPRIDSYPGRGEDNWQSLSAVESGAQNSRFGYHKYP